MLSYIIPTKDRPDTLARTLGDLGALPPHDAEVIVIDNASHPPISGPRTLANGLPLIIRRLNRNLGAAARNLGAQCSHRSSRWLIMLDDDSSPKSVAFVPILDQLAPGVAAASADIFLADGRREQGGLPEVFVGCGVAIRSEVFARLGGYDASFGYYAEEYDLAARMILEGYRIEFLPEFRVEHRKSTIGRDFSRIARNLVRNNCRVASRYSPDACRWSEIRTHLTRYARIAQKERAILGYLRGLADLATTRDHAPRTSMSRAQWDRFAGAQACRDHLSMLWNARRPRRVALVDEGKNLSVVRSVLAELGVAITPSAAEAEALVIATLSPGPMLDALAAWRSLGRTDVVTPWNASGERLVASLAA